MSIIFDGTFPMTGPIDGSKWKFNAWTPPNGGGSYYGRTQQRQQLPDSNGGVMLLKLDSYNPSDPKHLSFVGSEAISTRLFDLKSGPIAFEAKVKYAQSQRGIIGGFFTFAGPPTITTRSTSKRCPTSSMKCRQIFIATSPLARASRSPTPYEPTRSIPYLPIQ